MKERARVCGRGESSAGGSGSGLETVLVSQFFSVSFTLRGHLLDLSHLAVSSWTLPSSWALCTLRVWVIPPFSLPTEEQQWGACWPESGGGEHCPWSLPALNASLNFFPGRKPASTLPALSCVINHTDLVCLMCQAVYCSSCFNFVHTGSIFQ